MKKLIFSTPLLAALLLCCGCNNPIAKGVAGKTISGSGTVVYGRVGLDATTQTPEMTSLFVSGDYASITGNTEVFRLEESEDASIFNANSKTKKRKIFFASGDKKRIDAVIEAFTTEVPSTGSGRDASEK